MRAPAEARDRVYSRAPMLPVQRPFPFTAVLLSCLSALAACASTDDGSNALLRGTSGVALAARMAVADTRFSDGDADAALEDYESIHADAERVRARATVAESAAQVASSLACVGRAEEAGAWVDRAADSSSASRPIVWSRVLLARGLVATADGDLGAARGRLIELFNYCGVEGMERRAIEAAAFVSRASHGQERIDWITRAVHAAGAMGDEELECELQLERALVLGEAGLDREALAAFDEACRTATADGASPALRFRARWAHARGLVALGRTEDARRELDEIAATVQALYVKRPSRERAAVLGLVLGELGHIDVAEGHLEQARARFVSALRKLTEAGSSLRLERARARITAALAGLEPTAQSD